MARDPHVQVVRRSAGTWEVTRVNLIQTVEGEHAWDYDVIGRVVLEGGLYYAERAKWGEVIEYERLARGWLIRARAVRELTHPPAKVRS